MNSRKTAASMVKSKRIALIILLVAFSVGIATCTGLLCETFQTAGEEEAESESSFVIGIDLGTTHSCVGVYRNGYVEIIVNDQGNRITPSWVSFSDSERLIGEAAKDQASLNAERTIFDIKRLLGRKFDDPEIQRDMKMLPYKIVNKQGKPYVEVHTKDGDVKVYSPEEISAMVFGKMKETAEAYSGQKVKDAVVTVPAYFSDAQREATIEAGTIAGLNVVRIINEPTAAAIAYGLNDKKGGTKNILVFDLGGGTFDVSILTVEDGVFEVLSINGDTHLGGEDFNHRVMDYFIKLIKKKYNKDISNDNKALGKLRKECERAKHALSSQHKVRVDIESLFDGVDFSELLSRARFEESNMDLFKKTMEPVEKAMKDAGLKKSEIDEIILVGGSTRIPKVQEILKEYFNGKEANKGVNPDEAVAYGAADQGGILFNQYGKLSKGPRLSKDDIDRIIQEAEAFAEEEKRNKERIDAKNKLETYIYNTKSTIGGKTNDKISSEYKEKIENALKAGLKWLKNETNQETEKEDFKEKMKEIEEVCNPVIQQAYATNDEL